MPHVHRACVGLCILGFVLSCGRVRAQTWEVFDMNSAGFPSNAVTDIVQDGVGNIWVGTEWGLCKYNGTSWSTFQTTNSGIPDNRVEALAVDSLDHIWIGTVQGGLSVFDGITDWTYYNAANSPLPDDQIKCLTIDHRGWVWIGTFLGALCYTGTEWRLYNDQPESYDGLVLNGAVIEDIAVRDDGLVAIGTLNGGFLYLTDSVVEAHATYIDQFFDNTQVGVAFDTVFDETWLATPSQGLLRGFGDWQGGFWFQYATWNSLMPVNSLTSVVVDQLGRPWVGSVDAGLIMKEPNDQFISYTSSNSGLPVNGISTLFIASDGALWIGTYGGGAVRMTLSNGMPEWSMSLGVFPNPTQGMITVTNPSSLEGRMNWSISDSEGRMLVSGTSTTLEVPITLDLSAFKPGVYILTIVASQGRYRSRIIRS